MITDLRCSRALESIIGPESSIHDFFERTWQKECKIFRSIVNRPPPPTRNQQNALKTTSIEECPLTNLVDNAWPALVSLLQQAGGRFEDDGNNNDNTLTPMFFSHGTPVPPDAYNNSVFHAYLDGCSVVINHADWISADIAHLCLDLTKSIPHVYANTYLTPPSSQAVAPHADDRDVFVIQLIGKKHWKVYKTVPIPYPYPAEQVGKAELKVPKQILKGPTVFNTVLEPGDVLYMPRGYVHEAHTLLDECSFHVTIAMPTHDWTLAGAMTAATHHALCQVVDYRMALPTSLFSNTNSSTNGDLEIVNQQLNQALQRVQQQVTIESIMNDLQTKTKHHNERANAKRMTIIQTQKQQVHNKNTSTPTTNIIGREAADSVTLTTRVRASTEQEKAQVKLSNEKPRGLHVRPETAEALMTILQRLKQNPGRSCRVQNLGGCLVQDSVETVSNMDSSYICQLTLLSFAKCCVELGGMIIDGSIDE